MTELDPASADAFYTKGLAYQEMGDEKRVYAAFDSVTYLEPYNAYAWNRREVALFNPGKYHETQYSFERVLSIRKDPAEAVQYSKRTKIRLMDRANRYPVPLPPALPVAGSLIGLLAYCRPHLNREDESSPFRRDKLFFPSRGNPKSCPYGR